MHFNRLRRQAGHGVSQRDNQTLGAFGSLVVVPLFFTMTLAGIWHGAGFQFLIFGLMHGVYLTINHAWRMFGPKAAEMNRGRLAEAGVVVCKVVLTYLAVLAAQVMFRASSLGAALQMLGGMIGLHGIDAFPLPNMVMTMVRHLGPIHTFFTQTHHILIVPGEDSTPGPASLALRFFIVWALPNSQTIMAKFSPSLTAVRPVAPRWLSWQPTVRWALALGFLLALSLMSLQQTKVFLYFQF